ncbi:MAG: helix-turn-helix domain-containing protein [Alphaproteobacteria bacterium]|nr:helix-turn-helix domain-containing protein [Alphaproteobacteria bacterium]
MTNLCDIAPMVANIAILVSDRAQALDVTGPAAVFSAANDEVDDRPPYKLHILSSSGGPTETISGVALVSQPLSTLAPEAADTCLLVGHDEAGMKTLIKDTAMRDWLRAASQTARRWGSVCSGSVALAAWGLLEGKRASTHWAAAPRMARSYPGVVVDPDAIFTVDGNVWTSAGVTTGIDLSLAMVEADLGQDVAMRIARRLIVYMRRPGSQSQFSGPLQRQHGAANAYDELINWAKSNLGEPLSVEVLAARAGQSLRTFQRRFREQVGQSPASFIETLRLERAKALIGSGVALKIVASEVGYPSASQLTQVFRRRFGLSPSVWRTMHAQAL